MTQERAAAAMTDRGVGFTLVTQHEPAASLAEAAELRGLTPDRIVKSLVVRRGDADYLFVLVPGDRQTSWPKLRTVLGVSRVSMPSAHVALEATGYERGTITPFGSTTPWPVIADQRVAGTISIGAGAHGVSATVDAATMIDALAAQVADVTDPMQ